MITDYDVFRVCVTTPPSDDTVRKLELFFLKTVLVFLSAIYAISSLSVQVVYFAMLCFSSAVIIKSVIISKFKGGLITWKMQRNFTLP